VRACEQLNERKEPAAFADGSIASDPDGYVWIQHHKFPETFCQDVSDDEALVMAATQKTPLRATFSDTLTSRAAWHDKPAWYQVSTQDRVIDPDNARSMAERIKPVKTVELDASHASPVSQPAAVADLIEAAANEFTR
jgi:pimeloyl-ACP methyl ester carboxylesterase